MTEIVEYYVEGDEIVLVPFGDQHWGNINCDKQMVYNVAEYIKKHKCYWLGMGDYGDAIIPKDPRFDYYTIDPEYKTPQEQYQKIYTIFKPIASKCLGLLDGNHDINHWKRHSHNYVKELAEKLGVRYLTIEAFIRLIFRDYKTCFDIYAHHGWTGARTKGAKVNRIYDLELIFPMRNLYLMGHTHDLGLADEKPNLYIDEKLEIRDRLARFVFTGSFLRGYVKGHPSYVSAATYRPTNLGSPAITIRARQGKATVNFDVEIKHIR